MRLGALDRRNHAGLPAAEDGTHQPPCAPKSDFSLPFTLHTDVSETGLGAVLSLEFEGEEHQVLYTSRKLIPAEKKYAAVQREAGDKVGSRGTALLPGRMTLPPTTLPCNGWPRPRTPMRG
ncbi:hypothetical protein QTP70_010201 [Hemibagrus guttatus]|uniref:Reverse transcriptase/retrotransposon-derived protein RNase H-like domain-containing protein n=1 Tax=Hemibagrus guttatus TaxID=175788 RepID=A0AAE0UIF0_9TELE|nr:hypothetical protein QTP70_010201 [Hemibagrus guttatus]KAK3522894.1 hypothetical protein QTP86_007324 [Hemibagrus guttatus]